MDCYGGFHSWGYPLPAGWFIRENAVKMDELGDLYFRKPPDRLVASVNPPRCNQEAKMSKRSSRPASELEWKRAFCTRTPLGCEKYKSILEELGGLDLELPVYHIYLQNLWCKHGQIEQHIESSHLEGKNQFWSFRSTPSVAVKGKPRTLEEGSQIDDPNLVSHLCFYSVPATFEKPWETHAIQQLKQSHCTWPDWTAHEDMPTCLPHSRRGVGTPSVILEIGWNLSGHWRKKTQPRRQTWSVEAHEVWWCAVLLKLWKLLSHSSSDVVRFPFVDVYCWSHILLFPTNKNLTSPRKVGTSMLRHQDLGYPWVPRNHPCLWEFPWNKFHPVWDAPPAPGLPQLDHRRWSRGGRGSGRSWTWSRGLGFWAENPRSNYGISLGFSRGE